MECTVLAENGTQCFDRLHLMGIKVFGATHAVVPVQAMQPAEAEEANAEDPAAWEEGQGAADREAPSSPGVSPRVDPGANSGQSSPSAGASGSADEAGVAEAEATETSSRSKAAGGHLDTGEVSIHIPRSCVEVLHHIDKPCVAQKKASG